MSHLKLAATLCNKGSNPDHWKTDSTNGKQEGHKQQQRTLSDPWPKGEASWGFLSFYLSLIPVVCF